MFEIIFGLIWCSITGIVTFGFYGVSGGEFTVNGEYVTQAEFNSMLFPKIFLGLFWIIGIFVLIKGIKRVLVNQRTAALGEVCYGKINRVFSTGSYVNGNPVLAAEVMIYISSESKVEILAETIGLNRQTYPEGSLAMVKYYKGDINFIEPVDSSIVPSDILTALRYDEKEIRINTYDNIDEYPNSYYEDDNEDIITIGGIRYKKID